MHPGSPEELGRLGAVARVRPLSPRRVGVHWTGNADEGHDSRVEDEDPDRDDHDPGPRGGDGPDVTRFARHRQVLTETNRHVPAAVG